MSTTILKTTTPPGRGTQSTTLTIPPPVPMPVKIENGVPSNLSMLEGDGYVQAPGYIVDLRDDPRAKVKRAVDPSGEVLKQVIKVSVHSLVQNQFHIAIGVPIEKAYLYRYIYRFANWRTDYRAVSSRSNLSSPPFREAPLQQARQRDEPRDGAQGDGYVQAPGYIVNLAGNPPAKVKRAVDPSGEVLQQVIKMSVHNHSKSIR